MTIKWSKKECIKAITELKDPLENKGATGQQGLSPLVQKLREMGTRIRGSNGNR